jgi:lipopolysaccharide export system protein LptC
MSANPPEQRPPVRLPAGDRLGRFGAARRQSAYTETYTQLVRGLRVVLPLVGLLTFAIVLLWPKIRAEFNHPTKPSQEERQARMINGRYVGSDAHGRPYTVTYESAEQPPGGGPVQMVNPVAELTLQNGRWVALKASHGVYDQAAGTFDMSGDVELFHDEGYRFSTAAAHVEFSKNLVWGDRAVRGRGPKGEIVARGFRVINNGDAIVFTGPSRLILRPDAARIPEPETDKK